MGIRMPIENWPVGDRCDCHPQADKTPSKIYAYFYAIEQCPLFLLPPNLHVFTLYQDEENPCKWANDVNTYGWIVELEWQCEMSQVQLLLYRGELDVYFHGLLSFPVLEHDQFANWWWICGGNQTGKKGCGQVFWHERALELVEGLNFENDGNLFMEFFVTDAGAPIYKFCFLDHYQNQKILLEIDEFPPGSIVLWYGSIVTIPEGWHLCNGTEGTPDLSSRFVEGASDAVPPDDKGGAINHTHEFIASASPVSPDGHYHILPYGTKISPDLFHEGIKHFQTDTRTDSGSTDSSEHIPPWRALCYIMKL